jgi:hypothetical protein
MKWPWGADAYVTRASAAIDAGDWTAACKALAALKGSGGHPGVLECLLKGIAAADRDVRVVAHTVLSSTQPLSLGVLRQVATAASQDPDNFVRSVCATSCWSRYMSECLDHGDPGAGFVNVAEVWNRLGDALVGIALKKLIKAATPSVTSASTYFDGLREIAIQPPPGRDDSRETTRAKMDVKALVVERLAEFGSPARTALLQSLHINADRNDDEYFVAAFKALAKVGLNNTSEIRGVAESAGRAIKSDPHKGRYGTLQNRIESWAAEAIASIGPDAVSALQDLRASLGGVENGIVTSALARIQRSV